MERTHTCGDLSKKNDGKEVVLKGWVHSRRDHGGIIFIDLRDRYGLTQIVLDPKIVKQADALKKEWIIEVKGKVRPRPKGTNNKEMPTGEIEVVTNSLTIINESKTPPIEIDDRAEINEDTRLKYRFLDLRRPKMQKNIIARYKITKTVRDYMDKEGFLEIETPFLTKSTPEGSRDYLVPSRIHQGKFYALPQSPQLFKQLLMVSGFDKYFQIVRCMRDEDLRADRQPEFTQIDLEISHPTEEKIMLLMEGLIRTVFKNVLNVNVKTPFPKYTYKQAMEDYGTDKPDLRFELKLQDITEVSKKTDFQIFKNAEQIKCIVSPEVLSKKQITEDLTEFVKQHEAKGLAFINYDGKEMDSSILKFFKEEHKKELLKKLNIKKGSILIIADKPKIVAKALGALRVELAKRQNLVKNDWNFLWVYDFPMFEHSEEEERLVAVHHPFTAPKEDDVKLLEKNPELARARAYDIILNGIELGGGSIRIHRRETQEKVFKILGISIEEAQQKFGFLLEALSYGAPDHGGIALGLDRFAMLLTGNESIREVIAFPKNKAAIDLMMDAPSPVVEQQLKELGINLRIRGEAPHSANL